jgi:DNA-binding protein H-NS
MIEFQEIACNKSRLRAACKELDIKQLTAMATNLAEFIEKRAEEEVVIAEQAAKKEVEKKAILDAIAKAGLNPEDFFGNDIVLPKKSRKPVSPKYRINDDQGVNHEWSGRGRTPKVFAEYFNSGGSKDTCLI